MVQIIFERVEKKYILTQAQYQALKGYLKGYMKSDVYGVYTVCNIYYDTPDQLLIRRSIEKPKYKEKLRLRSYGIPSLDSTVFLEIKKKYQGIVYKRRLMFSLAKAYDILAKRHVNDHTETAAEMNWLLHRYDLRENLFLAYEREAFVSLTDDTFRLTFDQHVRSRRCDMHLEYGDHGEELFDDGRCIMEVKISGAMPLWLTSFLSEHGIYPASFSKYGSIYKKMKEGVLC